MIPKIKRQKIKKVLEDVFDKLNIIKTLNLFKININ